MIHLKHLVVGCLLTLIASCDGGIFGTSDGNDDLGTVVVDASEPVAPESGNDTPIDSAAPDGTGTPPAAGPDEQLVPTSAFENLQISGTSDGARLALVNLSKQDLNVETSNQTDVLFPEAIQPGTVSATAKVPGGATALTVVDISSNRDVLVLSPLNLGAFSYSTLIARDRPSQTLSTVQVIALPSLSSATDATVANVRVLLAAELDADDTPAAMTLVPSGASPGSTDISLGIVSSESFGSDSAYQVVTPGDYQLTDALERFAAVPVSIETGKVYTLIITGPTTPPFIVQDSSLDDQ